MKDKTTHLYVDSHERTLILHSLVELKNALIRQGRYTDCIRSSFNSSFIWQAINTAAACPCIATL